MESIKISNFRKIKDTWDLNLAPVTFFTGTNNSGKSTVFKALLILEDHINSNNHFELDFNGENARKHKIDCYNNALNRINQSENKKDLYFQYSNRDFEIKFHFQPGDDKANGKGKLIQLEVKREDNAKLIMYHMGGLNYQLVFDDTLLERNMEPDNNKNLLDNSVLVRTIENLLEDDIQELDKLEKEIIEAENQISNLKQTLTEKGEITAISEGKNTLFSLNSVVRELNISLDRAIDFLNSKGIYLDAKPTTKINFSTYKLLKRKFALDVKMGKSRLNVRILLFEKKIKTNQQKIISLNQKIADSKKKLRIVNKKLDVNNSIAKPTHTYSPEFSLEDFHPSERTIDRIIRKVLPKYLRENDKSIQLADIRSVTGSAYRLGDKINSILFFSVDHLSAHRNNQTRLYINNNTSTDINELIKENSSSPINKKSNAGQFLKIWMKKFDIGDDYRIKPIDGVATKIEILEENYWVNLVDKGFGAGQIFSILLKIALCIDDTKTNLRFRFSYHRKQLIVIEEPEANLHPALQSKLADLFFRAYHEFGVRFIIETHSEYIIRQSQYLNIKHPNIFGLLYFGIEDGPYPMNYLENGKFDKPFGAGFFNVADDLAVEMYKANLRNK